MTSPKTAFERAIQQATENPLNAFVSVVDPQSFATADASGEFAGVPFAVKDNIDTVALPTSANTPALVGSKRDADHGVVAKLLEAGALLVGKTNLHELAFGITTGAAAHPATMNPFDNTKSPGGSSGGSGAAVGAGDVPFALATDTGGSVSVPAAWCGVYGYRPSIGRWADGGAAPLSKTRDAVGVIAESFDYLTRVDAVVRETSSEAEAPEVIRLGIPLADSVYLSQLSDDVREVWNSVIEQLRGAAGVELVEVGTDHLHELDAACGIPIVLYETPRDLSAYLANLPAPVTYEEVFEQAAAEDVKGLLAMAWEGRDNHDAYQEHMNTRAKLQQGWDALFAEHNISGLLRPTVAISPTPIGDEFTTQAFGEEVPTFATVTRNAGPGSTSGQPGVTIPAGIGSAGLPVGVTIDGQRDADDLLFAVAQKIDDVIGVRSPLLAD